MPRRRCGTTAPVTSPVTTCSRRIRIGTPIASRCRRQIVQSGLERWVTIEARDLEDVHERWEAVDYLHVDVSNNGGTFRTVFDQWSHKVRQIILLEGGSAERDNVAWMHQYQKPAIGPALADLRRAHPDWSFTTLEPFPSLTIACNAAAVAAASAR